jgi:hypothetical protein
MLFLAVLSCGLKVGFAGLVVCLSSNS